MAQKKTSAKAKKPTQTKAKKPKGNWDKGAGRSEYSWFSPYKGK